MVKETIEKLGGLDIIINNAASTSPILITWSQEVSFPSHRHWDHESSRAGFR